MSFINSSWWLVPLIITIFSGILCPAMGTVLITHKRLLQVNLISHCVLPGLALALALGIHPSIGGVISGLLGSVCLLYTSPSPRDGLLSRMPSSA